MYPENNNYYYSKLAYSNPYQMYKDSNQLTRIIPQNNVIQPMLKQTNILIEPYTLFNKLSVKFC